MDTSSADQPQGGLLPFCLVSQYLDYRIVEEKIINEEYKIWKKNTARFISFSTFSFQSICIFIFYFLLSYSNFLISTFFFLLSTFLFQLFTFLFLLSYSNVRCSFICSHSCMIWLSHTRWSGPHSLFNGYLMLKRTFITILFSLFSFVYSYVYHAFIILCCL
jgi:hypothetical protein